MNNTRNQLGPCFSSSQMARRYWLLIDQAAVSDFIRILCNVRLGARRSAALDIEYYMTLGNPNDKTAVY